MSLKFLIDMNLAPDWVERFRQDGWDAVHWSFIGDPRATDTIILEYARTNRFAVFTHDLDLSTVLAITKAVGPSVLQVRTQDVTPGHLAPLVFAAIREHSAALASGALVTLDEAGARVRVLPLV
jgi:predicted nuclease of predicted toxin-antitoxin system